MEVVNIEIKKYIVTSMAVSSERAEPIFTDIKEALLQGKNVIVDFSGVKLVITAFLNIALGKLYGVEEFSKEFIEAAVRFKNTNESIEEMINEVKANSLIFYSNREEGRRRNEILNDTIDGEL